MDNQDNHLEDFFNRSLDSFNDEPSAAVWAGIERRLAQPKPFYHHKIFWLMNSIWLAIVMGIGWWGSGQQHQVADLEMHNGRLVVENQQLSAGWLNCQQTEQVLVEELEVWCNQANLNQQKVIPPNRSGVANILSPLKEWSPQNNLTTTSTVASSIFAQDTSKTGRNILSYEKNEVPFLRSHLLNPLVTQLPNSTIILAEPARIKENDTLDLINRELPNFRYGGHLQLATNFVTVTLGNIELVSNPKLSYSIGLATDIRMANRNDSYFRFGLNYVSHRYGLDFDEAASELVSRFPSTDQVMEEITRADINNNYLEFSLGGFSYERVHRKWRFLFGGSTDFRFDFLDNYKYHTKGSESAPQVYSVSVPRSKLNFLRVTSYLGLEKKLKRNNYLQLSLYFTSETRRLEQTILQSISTLGLRSTFLFGKEKKKRKEK